MAWSSFLTYWSQSVVVFVTICFAIAIARNLRDAGRR
jgi:hypothetical protein